MCGIAGIFLADKNDQGSLLQIKAMTDLLSHRGPDDSGYFKTNKVALGHRRLSIIDLSVNGKQPMLNSGGTLALVFNGEIYNFKELRTRLVSKGYRFYSQSDSEVILYLYEEYGSECVQYLEGMFAFAIYDMRDNSLFLARDRIGEKPLYYFKDYSGFYFSSEIKSFEVLEKFKKEISPAGLKAYFNYIQIPAPLSVFKGVHKVCPAHWLHIDSRGFETTAAYWHVDCTKKNAYTLDDAKMHLRTVLMDSVQKMLVSDVPVGILLSGGVDSSLILALAVESGNKDIQTFTVGDSREGTEDQEYLRAKKIVKKYGLKHQVYDYSSAHFSDLIMAAKLCDEPLGLLEIFYLFGIFGNIKDQVKVILTGNGADEVFAGYSSYSKTKILSDSVSYFHALIKNSNSLCNWGAAAANVFAKEKTLNLLYSNRVKQDIFSDPGGLLSEAMKLVSYDNVLDAKLFMDLFILCNHAMSGIPDIAGMSKSIEVRSPFLHHKVVEFAAALPVELKVMDKSNSLYNKFLLKELACDFYDRSDIYVEKYGFGRFINAFDLMKTTWKSDIEEALFDPKLVASDLLDMKCVRKMWLSFLDGTMTIKQRLIFARLAIFSVWYKYRF